MRRFLGIGMAGFLGSLTRYGIAVAVNRFAGSLFPYGTLAVNLIGCFVIGLLMELALKTFFISEHLKLIFVVGFLGAMTTFSAFSYETVRLWEENQFMLVFINVVANTGGCFAATMLGQFMVRIFIS